EPALAGCEACVADNGALLPEPIAVADLRARSDAFLRGARSVIVPSQDTATRMRRHFRGVKLRVVPHEADAALPPPPPPRAQDGRCRVCIVGAIGVHKGYDVLLGCARDAAARRLPLEFVLVGSSIDDARLIATERVFVTGRFTPEEVLPLIRAQRASIGLVPSVWPETWCLALTELWQAGLQAAAFDLGAPAERIRHTGFGLVLPYGLPPAGINNALLATCGLARP
ncbi:MAG: glycosyltransferase, partial [Rhodospirillales bacterium]|nr:glycosyltransferase [Rhodospirillales bacterium]